MAETATNQNSVGAGCDIWEVWPNPFGFRQNGADPGQQVYTRAGQLAINASTKSYNINSNFGWNANIAGRSGATIGATVAGAPNGLQYSFQGWRAHPAKRAVIGAPSLFRLDQYGAYSLSMIASFNNPAGALANTIDNGLEFTTAGAGVIDDGQCLRLGTPGVGFRCSGPNTVQAFSRGSQAGAVTIQDVTPAGFIVGGWHHYEIRLLAAFGETEALCKWFLDGALVYSKSWDAVNSMPETNANWEGLGAQIVTNGGTVAGFTVHQAVYKAARDEINLL